MARDNGWGAPRIQGELMKLGIQIDERTVSRYLPKRRPSPDKLQNWLAFPRNHRDALVGMDVFTVPTVTFGQLWVFVWRGSEEPYAGSCWTKSSSLTKRSFTEWCTNLSPTITRTDVIWAWTRMHQSPGQSLPSLRPVLAS